MPSVGSKQGFPSSRRSFSGFISSSDHITSGLSHLSFPHQHWLLSLPGPHSLVHGGLSGKLCTGSCVSGCNRSPNSICPLCNRQPTSTCSKAVFPGAKASRLYPEGCSSLHFDSFLLKESSSYTGQSVCPLFPPNPES